jgi:hypothetical protein
MLHVDVVLLPEDTDAAKYANVKANVIASTVMQEIRKENPMHECGNGLQLIKVVAVENENCRFEYDLNGDCQAYVSDLLKRMNIL